MGKLTLNGSLQISAGPSVSISEPNWKDIPSEIIGYRETYTNCTSLQQDITFKHAESTLVGSKVSKNQSIKTGQKIGAKVDFKFSDAFGAGMTVEFSKEVTISETEEENSQQTKSFDITVPLKIAPNTEVKMDHYFVRREVPVPFTGWVSLDGAVSSNREGITSVSQVLTTPQDRTFSFSGIVSSAALVEGRTTVTERKMSATTCASSPGWVLSQERYNSLP